MSAILLGRTDNAVKNYSHCHFRTMRASLASKLETYLSKCREERSQKYDESDLIQRLLRFFVHRAQRQYLDHLREKRDKVGAEKYNSGKPTKVCDFKFRLLSNALKLYELPQTGFNELYSSSAKTVKQLARLPRVNQIQAKATLSQMLDLSSLKKVASQ